ncbi:MAG: nickel-dependent lactate racemase [Flexilinea sp.]
MKTIKYINRTISLDIPEKNLLFEIQPANYPAVDAESAILTALANPIGTKKLEESLKPGMKVIIMSDDNTRPTPMKMITPILLKKLNDIGIPDSDIRIIIASGTHRAMTDEELLDKFGSEILKRIKILPHRYKNKDEMVHFGVTKRGINIWANKNVVEADFRITVGNIVPHHPAGWSAGAKTVLPGVGGVETVAQMHFLGSKNPAIGRVDSEMRKEMEDFAESINLNFILNIVMNRDDQIVGAFAGHYIQAHREGVKLATLVYGCPIPELADLTISSTSPFDFDLFQGDKGITSAEPATKNGGEIILVSGCVEGVCPAHPELAEYCGKMTNEAIWKLIDSGKVTDPLTAAEAVVLNDINDKMTLTICSEGLTPEICQGMKMKHVEPSELNNYVQQRIKENPVIKIGLIHKSSEVFPYIKA